MIIGITGHMGSGKDTLAAYFVRAHGFVRVGFADALKAEVLARLPQTLVALGELCFPEMSSAAIGAYLLRSKPPVIRALLQEYGTEVRRTDDPSYWLDAWEARRPVEADIVAPDVRFLNEAEHIKRLGGWVIRVQRPGYEGDGHASEREQAMIPCDRGLGNTGSIADLEAQAEVYYRSLLV